MLQKFWMEVYVAATRAGARAFEAKILADSAVTDFKLKEQAHGFEV